MRRLASIVFSAVFAGMFNSDAGLVAHYTFDEGTQGAEYTGAYADSSGNGYNLVNVKSNNPEVVAGIAGNAMRNTRDSADDYYPEMKNNNVMTGISSFSFSMFVDPYVNNSKVAIFRGGNWGIEMLDQDTEAEAFNVWLKNTSGTVVDVRGGSIPYEKWESSGTVGDTVNNDVKWHHIAGSYDETTGVVSLYVDGMKYIDTLAGGGAMDAGTAGYTYNFNGLIDDLQIYDTVLSDNEVSFLGDNPGSVIPEPGTLSLVAALSLALWGVRRISM